ncbi:GTPase Era [bacterium BMS3Abin01]|nr:GTPase Era [bacterium BMS3Abin01]
MKAAGEVSHSGFVAVVGRPNVGKSTLVNSMVGQKVAITSDKPQTTRHRIAGIVNRDDSQLVLLDLPGFQRPRDLLTERMQQAVDSTLGEVDLILLVMSADEPTGGGDRLVAGRVFAAGTPVIIAVNKIDLVREEKLLPAMDAAAGMGDFEELFPVSALTGKGIEHLEDAIIERLLPGPRYFPEDMVSDQPERILVGELVREQALRLTREEVPHSVAVEVLSMDRRGGSGIVDIAGTVIVERKSQKGILIGRQGSMIKEIGTGARKEIEALLGSRVFLDLSVKVRKRWRDDPRRLGDLGL